MITLSSAPVMARVSNQYMNFNQDEWIEVNSPSTRTSTVDAATGNLLHTIAMVRGNVRQGDFESIEIDQDEARPVDELDGDIGTSANYRWNA